MFFRICFEFDLLDNFRKCVIRFPDFVSNILDKSNRDVFWFCPLLLQISETWNLDRQTDRRTDRQMKWTSEPKSNKVHKEILKENLFFLLSSPIKEKCYRFGNEIFLWKYNEPSFPAWQDCFKNSYFWIVEQVFLQVSIKLLFLKSSTFSNLILFQYHLK
jgi:hypothetical protein